jgi:hypothetical protein
MRVMMTGATIALAIVATSGFARAQSSGDQTYSYVGHAPDDWDGFKLRDGYTKLRKAGVPVPRVRAIEGGGLNLYFTLPDNSTQFDPSGQGPAWPSTLEAAEKVLISLTGGKVVDEVGWGPTLKDNSGPITSDKPYEFWVDPNGKLTVRIDPDAKLSKTGKGVDAGLRSAGELYDQVAKILRARGLQFPEQKHTSVVEALEQAMGKKLTTAERYKADQLFTQGETGLEILRDLSLKPSDAVVLRVDAFDEQVRQYPRIRTDRTLKESRDTDWSILMDSAAKLGRSSVRPGEFASRVVGEASERGPRRSTGMTSLLETRIADAKAHADGKETEKR